MKKYFVKFLVLVSFLLLFLFSALLKISFGLGSYKFFFTGINFILPLLGSFFSIFSSMLIIPIFFIFKKITLDGALTLGIPTLVATLNWSNFFNLNNNKIIKKEFFSFLLNVILPLLAIILFIVHPVGKDAYLYSFYWFIPVIIYFVQKLKNNNSIFLIALASTFLAHAVGSIIWLYSINMSSLQWLSLIPIVAVERLIFACGMSVNYLLFKKFIEKKFKIIILVDVFLMQIWRIV